MKIRQYAYDFREKITRTLSLMKSDPHGKAIIAILSHFDYSSFWPLLVDGRGKESSGQCTTIGDFKISLQYKKKRISYTLSIYSKLHMRVDSSFESCRPSAD